MKKDSLIKTILPLWRLIGRRRQVQLGLFFVLSVFSIFAEMLTIGAVLPFITVLTNPDALFDIQWLTPILKPFDELPLDELMLPLTLVFIAIVILAALLRIFVLWLRFRLARAVGVQLRTELFLRILSQPYEYHVNQNSSQLLSLVGEKSAMAIGSGIMQVLILLNASLLALGITAALLYLAPSVAIFPTMLLGSSYVLISKIVKNKVKENGVIVASSQPIAIKALQEGIGGIRDVIMDRSYSVFANEYKMSINRLITANTNNNFLGQVPRPILEVLGIVIIASLAYYLMIHSEPGVSPIPIIGAIALGAQRLLPSLQQIYGAWVLVKGAQPVIDEVVSSFNELSFPKVSTEKNRTLKFQYEIAMKEVTFSYPGHTDTVLCDVSYSIKKGERVGIIGKTGSGKSTLLDIQMGLLAPSKGCIAIDGHKLDGDLLDGWRALISHVPQSIYLSDNSIAENVAFGVNIDNIDSSRVKKAAKQANISTFIDGLPEGYNTFVGERGVRLSGGQRQRIGIARALYKNAEVIIFDEATSALDNETEASVMEAIDQLGKDLTVIIIAHRLSTLKNCDVIYRLDKGRIVETGTYAEIVGEE